MDLSFMAAQVRRLSSNLHTDVCLDRTFFSVCPSISWAWPVNKFFDKITLSIRLNTNNQDGLHNKFSSLHCINQYVFP